MLRRLLAILAASLLTFGLTSIASADTVGGGTFAGTAGDGAYYNHDYQNGNVDYFVSWERQSVRCGASEECGGHLYARLSVTDLPDYQGNNTCVQVVIDWDTPAGSPGDHYDSRMVRNCDKNSTWYLSTSDGFNEPNPLCYRPVGPGGPYWPCDMPVGRVQVSRFVPSTQNVVDGSKQCWYRESGHTLSDCENWEPTCPFGNWACRGWIRNNDGTHFIRDGGSPVFWQK